MSTVRLAFGLFAILCWSILAGASFFRFVFGRLDKYGVRFRRPESAIIAFAFALPPFLVAREFHWVTALWVINFTLAGVAVTGAVGVVVWHHYSSQR